MNTYADKTQENKNRSAANSLRKLQNNSESTLQFVDNRPEGAAQRKLQEMADNSPKVSQLKALQAMADNSMQAAQSSKLPAAPAANSSPVQLIKDKQSKSEKTKKKKEWGKRRDLKQAGKSAGHVSEIAVSKTSAPYKRDEIKKILSKPGKKISPHRIRTAQDAARDEFADGGRMMEAVRAIKKGGDLPPIEIFTHKGQLYTLDHRRLYAYRRANKPIPYIYKDSNKASEDFGRKFSSKDKGMSMKILPSNSEVDYKPEDVELSDDQYNEWDDDQFDELEGEQFDELTDDQFSEPEDDQPELEDDF